MSIAQISKYPVDEKLGGFYVTIKKTHKMYQLNGDWVHSVTIADPTGEMPADIKTGNYIPMQRNQRIRIVVGIIQAHEKGTKVFIDQFASETVTEPPQIMDLTGEETVVRSKIKCWLVAAWLQNPNHRWDAVELFAESDILKNTVTEIMKG